MSALNDMAAFANEHSIAAVSVIGLIAAMLSQRFRQLIIMTVAKAPYLFVRKTYLHKSLGDVFISYMTKNGHKNKRFAGELYGEDPAFIRSEKEVKHILYRDFGSNIQWFYGKGFFNWVIISGEPLEYNKDKIKEYSYVVYSFRWAQDIIKLLDEATETKNEKSEDDMEVDRFVVKRVSGGRFFKELDKDKAEAAERTSERELANPFSAYVPIKWEKSDIGEIIFHHTLEMMSLNPELEDLLEEIRFWFNSQDWYEERGVPWKRGVLFWGKPGTGKTMFARALAESLNVPLIIFDLASMSNTEFNEAWSKILPKRIVLFEDLDAVFHKRENIVSDDLTFDCLLNCLDGADKKQGILTIITTNHPETLDPALGGADDGEELKGKMPTRPGRIDRSVEFLPLDAAGRYKLAMRIMKDEEMAKRLVKEGKNDSAAQLQERCFRAAVEDLFNKKNNQK